MTDREFRIVKAKLDKSVKKWLLPLGLLYQRVISVRILREGGPDDHDVVASCDAAWEYKHATVSFYAHRLAESTDEELDYFVRHELCHILVNQMVTDGKAAKKNEERVVTELAQILDWVYKAGAGTLKRKR